MEYVYILIIVALIGFFIIKYFFKTSKFVLKMFITAVIFAFAFYFVYNTDLLECNGKWMFIDNKIVCNKFTEDGGKECSDSRECNGLCILEGDVGYCQKYEMLKGCFTAFNETEKIDVCIE